MIKLIRTARRLQDICEREGWRFCFIGGLAVQRWSETRLTEDVDATIFTGFGNERPVISRLLRSYGARREDAAQFARLHRVLLLEDRRRNVGIDISMGAFEFEEHAIDRSSEYAFLEDTQLRTCSAEDLIVFKAFADREIDWHDIKGILIRQQGRLDFELVEAELVPLVELKEEPAILDRWHKLKSRYP